MRLMTAETRNNIELSGMLHETVLAGMETKNRKKNSTRAKEIQKSTSKWRRSHRSHSTIRFIYDGVHTEHVEGAMK